MKHKIKKIFENAVWWSGVVMVGLILGISLQFVKAWTEPTAAPPNGNVGAPINTGGITQDKSGLLGVLGLLTTYLNVPGDVPAVGDILTAQESFPGSGVSDGRVAWAPGGSGSGWYVPTSLKATNATHDGDFGGYQGMNNFVQSDSSCGSGYHVCSSSDIAAYFQFHSQVVDSPPAAWYNGAFRGWSTSGNVDCEGWRSNNNLNEGSVWWRGVAPHSSGCGQSFNVLCCK